MEKIGPETDTRKHGAYFVRFRPADGRVGLVPVSEDAPDEVLLGLKWIARDWNAKKLGDSPFDRLCRRIREGKPATAITIEPYESKKLPAVRPLEVAFEPVVLDETSQTLAELSREAARELPKSETNESSSDVSAIRRFMLRSGIRVFWGGYSLLQTYHAATVFGIFSIPTVMWFALLLFSLLLPLTWQFVSNYSWFIVPGGVLVRGWQWNKWTIQTNRYTPSETVLVIEPVGPGHKASLIREKKIVAQKTLTTIESIALLGAWQSSIAPPELERLVDLR